MYNPNTQSNTDNITEVDTTKMLNGLDEIIKNSDSKTVSDIISEETSSFDEAFPNFYKDPKIAKYFSEKKLSDLLNEALSKNKSDDEQLSKFKESFQDMPGETPLQKYLNYSILEMNKKDGSWEDTAKKLKDQINSNYDLSLSQDGQTKSSIPAKLLEFTEDKKLVVDMDKLSNLINRASEQLSNLSNIEGSYYFFGLTSFMLWKGMVRTFDRGHKYDINTFKSDKSKLSALKHITNTRLAFTTAGSLILMIGINNYFNILPRIYNVNLDLVNSADSDNNHKSVFFLFSLLL